jgi:hypothetical protein
MRAALFVTVVLSLVGLSDTAFAKRESTLRYPYSLVWTTAVRMIRVDYESPITEKDKDEGYFLFSFVHEGKEHPGSFEVIEDAENGARVVVQIPAMPSYVEQMLIDKLERKLSQDHGSPRENKKPAPEPKKPAKPENDKKPAEEAPDDGEAAPKDKREE